jgi:2-oxoisovalerate dehydrogenase E1 component alpha subunit
VTHHAKHLATKHCVPILIEAMTYRIGHHSTSDDSTRYRSADEIAYWLENENPIARIRFFLEARKLWDSTQEAELRKQVRKDVLHELSRAERCKKPPAMELFTDVYNELPKHLREQKHELQEHLSKYKDKYALDEYANEATYKDPTPPEHK